MTPKVSILIPTYNRAGLLEEALESALAQDYPNLEIVVSDNASTDGTERLRGSYSDPRLSWHRAESNIGLDANWRKLLYELATGEYVKVLADDDFIKNPCHVTEAMILAEQGAMAVFSGAGALIEPAGDLKDISWDLPAMLDPEWWLRNLGRRDGKKVLFPNLTTCGLFHRETAKRFGAFVDPVFGMDYQLAFQFMLSGKTGYLGGIQCVERQHPANDGTRATLAVVSTGLKLYQRTFDFGLSQGLERRALEGFCRNAIEVFIQTFLVRAWGREKGGWPSSFTELYRTVAAVDAPLARRTILRPKTLAKVVLAGV